MTDRAEDRDDRIQAALARYVQEAFAPEDPLLRELRGELERRGFPQIQVSATTGRFLQVLMAALGALRILEIGTLGGYSAIWMARGLLPGGRLLTLEVEPEHAALAREYVARAGLDGVVEVRVGDAVELLPEIGPDGSFDAVFLDADKESYRHYADHALRLLRPGGVLLADNAFWNGRILGEGGDEPTEAIRAFNRHLAGSDAFLATVLPVGDGVAMAVKRG